VRDGRWSHGGFGAVDASAGVDARTTACLVNGATPYPWVGRLIFV
jgi:hypothetical protein